MASKHPHTIRNGIIATVIGGLILSAILMLSGFFIEAISWGWAGVIWLWGGLESDYSLPGWAFLIFGLLALIGLVVVVAFLYDIFRSKEEPAYRKYTEDMLNGAKWRWSWNGDKISNLWCFCPSCDAQLVYHDNYENMHANTDFICERCSSNETGNYYRSQGRVVATVRGDKDYALDAVKREILRRIRTDEHVSYSHDR